MKLALETIRVLRRFKNAVLEGPPGTGKSYVGAMLETCGSAGMGCTFPVTE
jgi:DNA replication protein DnaC